MAFEFLILGAGRGGTSLLMALLDTHSKLEILSEYASVECLMDKSRNVFQRVEAFREACLAEAARHSDKIWGNKITTEQLAALATGSPSADFDVLGYFFNQAFRTTKIIFILRDGRACVRSKVKRTGQSYETACMRWNYSVEVYRYLLGDPTRHLLTKFEDLLVDPPTVLRRITEFLGVPFEEGMLLGTDNPKLRPEYRNTGFDLTKMDTGPVADWYGVIEHNLRLCGYLQ
ncbi:MAG TPA: sulfotransferase [Candidatus Obscuribacterales bacterium]